MASSPSATSSSTATAGAVTPTTVAAANKAHANHANQVLLQTDPLHRACKAGNWSECKQLIEASGTTRQARYRYVNRRDANGSSPIFHCVWYGFYRVLALLVHHGANPNLQNNRRNTALHLVCEQMHWSCAGLLLQVGARVDIHNYEGKTCLMMIPPVQDKPEAADFANYMVSQCALYAKENAFKMDLFTAIPPAQVVTSSRKGSATNSYANLHQQQQQSPQLTPHENESIRRLCWSIQHLEKTSLPNPPPATAHPVTSLPLTRSASSLSIPAASLPFHRSFSAGSNHPTVGSTSPSPTPDYDRSSGEYAHLDPDLLAPIQALEWYASYFQIQEQPPSRSPSSQFLQPPSSPRIGSATPSPSAAAPVLSGETKYRLKDALQHFQKLAIQFPQSNLGPGLECRRDPQSKDANPYDATSAPPDRQGPALSFHGLSHLLHHLSSHWPGLPIAYKKFFLSYLIRFSTNISNACCMVAATRPIIDGWVSDRPNEQSVLLSLIDSVLDWLELHRGLSSQETDCSLVPPSRSFHNVVAALRMQPQIAPPPTAAALAAAAAQSGRASAGGTPKLAPQAPPMNSAISPSAAPSPAPITPSYGAMFSGIASHSFANLPSPMPTLTKQASTTGGSNRPLASPTMAGSVTPGFHANTPLPPNPFVPPATYIDDYEIASLVLELVASLLATLRLHSASIVGDMITGSKTAPAEEQLRVAVEKEELALSSNPNTPGFVKTYTAGGSGGYGSVAVVIHPSVAALGSVVKEGVHDAATEKRLQDWEKTMEAKIARRITVNQQPAAPFSPRTVERAAGNLTADVSSGRNTARAMFVDKSVTKLWRQVVRLFEQQQASSLMRLLAICIRAPFSPNVHPAIPLRVMYLLKEGFTAMKLWYPVCCDVFRSQEIISYTMLSIRNIQHLLRPPSITDKPLLKSPHFWKHAFDVATAVKHGKIPPPSALSTAVSIFGHAGQASHVKSLTPTNLDRKVVELHTTNPLEKAFQNVTLQAKHRHHRSISHYEEIKEQSSPTMSTSPSTTTFIIDPVKVSEAQAEIEQIRKAAETPTVLPFDAALVSLESTRAEQSDEDLATTKEIEAILGGGQLYSSDSNESVGATSLLKKLTLEEQQEVERVNREKKRQAEKTKLPAPELDTETLAEPLSTAQVPYSPRFKLQASPSVTALELASPTRDFITSVTQVKSDPSISIISPVANPRLLVTHHRFSRATEASRHKFQKSTKETVMDELNHDRDEKEKAEKKRLEGELNTPLKIPDPMTELKEGKVGVLTPGSPLFARAQALKLEPLNMPQSPVGHRASIMVGGMVMASTTGGIGLHGPLVQSAASISQQQIIAASNALPDFFSASTIAARMMLVDRCMDFVLALILDSASRAQALTQRKMAAKKLRDEAEAEEARQQAEEEKRRGLEPGSLKARSHKNDNPRAPDPIDQVHEASGHRTLKGLNELYGPPPLTTLCASFLNWGLVDSVLLMLSPLNQSLTCHRAQHRLENTNTEGIVLLTPDHENIGVLQSVQALNYLLRMDGCLDLIYMSPHALSTYSILTTTTDEHVANSILYLFSHLLRKRRWSERLLSLKGKNPTAAISEEKEQEESSPSAGASEKEEENKKLALIPTSDKSESPLESFDVKSSPAPPHVPLEYLLMKWARIAIQLSLACLPLKPWSTLPRSLILKNIPTLPSELPPKMLVYSPISQPNVHELDEIRETEERTQREHAHAKRMRRYEREQREQEILDRIFLNVTPGDDLEQLQQRALDEIAALSSASSVANSPRQSTYIAHPFARDSTLSSTSIPPEQSWFALHYTPPTQEQKTYVLSLQKQQREKLQRRLGELQEKLNSTPSAKLSAPFGSGNRSSSLTLRKLSLYDVQVNAALSAQGLAPPFTPVSNLANLPTSKQVVPYSSPQQTPTGPSLPDANLLVVEQFLFNLPSPASKARTLQQISRRSTQVNSPNNTENIFQDLPIEPILSPTSRSLQKLQKRASLVPNFSKESSPPNSGRRSSTTPTLLSDLTAAQDAARSRSISPAKKFAFPTSEELANRSQLSSARDPNSIDEEGKDGASNSSSSSDSDVGDLQPHERAERRRLKLEAKAEKKRQLQATEEARQRIRTQQAVQQLQQRLQPSMSEPEQVRRGGLVLSGPLGVTTPRRQRRNEQAKNTDADEASSTGAESTNKEDAVTPPQNPSVPVVGGMTALPSFSNIAISESLIYRIIHCFFGFTRTEKDARKLFDCGAIEFISGLINHPVFDISLHALKLLTILSTRFSQDYLVQLMEVLVRSHTSKCWLDISIGRTEAGDEVGFPWCNLDSIVSSCSDFLRVDVSFQPHLNQTQSSRFGSANSGSPEKLPPLRDERSSLAFQLLVNLCQDPLGRGYAAVKKQSIWYENLLHDILSHPSLKDLEQRQKLYQRGNVPANPRVSQMVALRAASPTKQRRPSTANTPYANALSVVISSPPQSRPGSRLGQVSDSRPGSSLGSPTLSTPQGHSRPSSRGSFSGGVPFGGLSPPSSSSLLNSMRPNAKTKVRRPSASTPAAEPFVSGGRRPSVNAATNPDQRLAVVSSPPPSTAIIPAAPFGGHWNTQGGIPFDRYFPGGAGIPTYPLVDQSGQKLPQFDGLDWQIPAAETKGSTELLTLLADSQLSTQPTDLRQCDLRSCSAMEHTVGTFLVCPRCRTAAYCCLAHLQLAKKSWHGRVCSVTQKKKIKPNQRLRYPVKPVIHLHSSLPGAVRSTLLNEDGEDEDELYHN